MAKTTRRARTRKRGHYKYAFLVKFFDARLNGERRDDVLISRTARIFSHERDKKQ